MELKEKPKKPELWNSMIIKVYYGTKKGERERVRDGEEGGSDRDREEREKE